MKGIILSAGQGRRLLPLTTNLPKCLIRIGGRTVLEWQLRMLAGAGIHHVVVVTGFGAAEVERRLSQITPPGMHARTLFNELYDRADNLVSCAVASPEMSEDFLLLNGDTLAEATVVERLLASTETPVAMAIAEKPTYDADDMKVSRAGNRVTRVGKDLTADASHGEAIGFSLYRGRGPELFTRALDEILSEPEGSRRWYLSAVDLLAGRGQVQAVGIGDARFAEIDYLQDVPRARALVSAFGETPLAAARWTRADAGAVVREEAAVAREALAADGDR
ncbi:MAG: phosphocholine cytidylyltransferase family protein [Deltaproteobacteria bacterium]|nr:phosphocholine cytidylyltransferase family protein [Deltaproteobacteria bacterium]